MHAPAALLLPLVLLRSPTLLPALLLPPGTAVEQLSPHVCRTTAATAVGVGVVTDFHSNTLQHPTDEGDVVELEEEEEEEVEEEVNSPLGPPASHDDTLCHVVPFIMPVGVIHDVATPTSRVHHPHSLFWRHALRFWESALHDVAVAVVAGAVVCARLPTIPAILDP